MNVLFVGGASGVGASCLAIEIGGQWVVVDAGIRMDRHNDALPDLTLLQEKDVRAIFVTHAHADHIGALPLLHQAFPMAPIFASRATGLLMEVMLADAVKIMERRAVEEMELPLYPSELVSAMLNRVRPIPLEGSITIAELPNTVIQTSPAGHIAGAISLGFTTPEGTIVVSGDISVTDQRTVAGAIPPPLVRPDLLVLKSTYGARLHANRQAEELRFVQAVAEGIERGGHVLIPAFGLGRSQEALLILVEAQQKKRIPVFPLYVDGLVRRVCSTYHLLPEALTPRLQNQIRKGYFPFEGSRITFVRDVLDRERLLAGPPACIVASSGMLTGGPSVWYASRLASQAKASILLAGYQDEESSGKRLLDVAEGKETSIILNGQATSVSCHVAKYGLSAHADAGELAAYATALHPRRVALVHGDDEARAALRLRLTDTEVLLPSDGTTYTIPRADGTVATAGRTHALALPELVTGIGKALPFEPKDKERLWESVVDIPALRVVTARELALIWDGEATQITTSLILQVLKQGPHFRYFVPYHSLEEAFLVRGRADSTNRENNLVGQVLFIQVAYGGSPKPALCRGLLPTASVRLQFAPGASDRIRYAYTAILDILGPLPEEIEDQHIANYLTDLSRQARTIRRSLSPSHLAYACSEATTYSLTELCAFAGLPTDDLAARLAVAELLQRVSNIFFAQYNSLVEEGQACYALMPTWKEALALIPQELTQEDAEKQKPQYNKEMILYILEQHIGQPPDLYKQSVNLQTGEVILRFHFPDIARHRYQDVLTEAAEEADVDITIWPHPHQGALIEAAQRVLPESLKIAGYPSAFHDKKRLLFHVVGQTTKDLLLKAQAQYEQMTGWHLTFHQMEEIIQQENDVSAASSDTVAMPTVSSSLASEAALTLTLNRLKDLPGFVRVEREEVTKSLVLTFLFPDAVRTRHKPVFQELAEQTGWLIKLTSAPSQKALIQVARRFLPSEVSVIGTAELFPGRKQVRLVYSGHISPAALEDVQTSFRSITGWTIALFHEASEKQPYIFSGSDSEKTAQKPQHHVPQHVLDATAALQYAQLHLGSLPGYIRVAVEIETRTLRPRFAFPEKALRDYGERIADVADATGWRVRLHPFPSAVAIKKVLDCILPSGLIVTSDLAIVEETHTVKVVCVGEASSAEVSQCQLQFLEETGGWSLVFRESPGKESVNDGSQSAPAMSRIAAMAHTFTVFNDAPDLYQLSGNERTMTLWLSFYFPERALVRYEKLLAKLAQETGWSIRLEEDAQQQALLEAALHVLPKGVVMVSKAVQREQQTVKISYTGNIEHEEREAIQRCYLAETGWLLELIYTEKTALHITNDQT